MRKDCLLFEPKNLAFIKGAIYFFSFITAILFSDKSNIAFPFAVVAYCCGVIGDYIEVCWFRKEEKSKVIIWIAGFLAILTFVVAVVAFAIAMNFDSKYSQAILEKESYIKIGLAFYWLIPIWCGFLIREHKPKHQNENKPENFSYYTVGNSIRP